MRYKDGYLAFREFNIYYKIFGSDNSKGTPLLVLHGGPGASHNYLLGLSELSNDRQIIFYDQIGGGLSDRPADDSIWTLDLFLEELVTVREQLQGGEYHLFWRFSG